MTISSIYKSLTICCLIICFGAPILSAQYNFKTEKKISCTEVKSQDRTGTCWSFATASFLESELIRMGHDNINLSEMFIVRNIYKDKAMNYVLRQGKANFSQGSLSHDLIRMTEKHGLITEDAYSGLVNGSWSKRLSGWYKNK
ncbi:MAG: bleomycin hydrolase [Saprospiraceae bacterium]|jgi:bleomycin hydrolase